MLNSLGYHLWVSRNAGPTSNDRHTGSKPDKSEYVLQCEDADEDVSCWGEVGDDDLKGREDWGCDGEGE